MKNQPEHSRESLEGIAMMTLHRRPGSTIPTAKNIARTAFALAACVLPWLVQTSSLVAASLETDGIRLSLTRALTNATLSWPLPDEGFTIEWAPTATSAAWQSVPEMLTVNDGHCEVTVPLDQQQRYFRLARRESGGGGPPIGTPEGFITAVLRSECTSAPTPPPPVGKTVVGPDYVIMTVASGDPLDYQSAQLVVTDAVFESLMPLYCGLSHPARSCVTNRVQWNLVTYDAGGRPRISGSPLSGAGFHYCRVTNGYLVAVVGGESASLPSPPPVGQVAVGADSVIMTLADGDPTNLEIARRIATDAVFESLMRRYCALPRGMGHGEASGRAQWKVATYDASGSLELSACAASGCAPHECVVSRGYITAVLRSECNSAPSRPPPVGETAVGPGYVIMTVADGDPLDYEAAQELVTDAMFESLMPLYCGLTVTDPNTCPTNRVQWNLMTYDAGGNPKISGGPASGPGFHYCRVTNGYLVAIVRGESASLPALPPVGQVAVGSDCVIMTIADGDPTNLEAAQRLATDAIFESLMSRYCALPRGKGKGQARGRAQWKVATYDAGRKLMLSACASSGCDFHACAVSKGYITAVLRSDCTSAPTPPPPVGETVVGPDYVIRTIADGDPLDYLAAQRVVTDAIFESLMPLYCRLAQNPTRGCVNNRVQWNLMTYDAGGNPMISGSPTSGPGYHYLGPCPP
jgi:hypothetical protein